MSIKASSQTTLIDLTDGYSVVLTNDNYTFLGTTNSVSGTQTTTSTIQALCGREVVPCTVGKVEAPTGLSIVSDGKSPSPTLTITATSALTQSGSVVIPVTIGEVVISKTFSYSIAFKGVNGSDGTSVSVKSTSVTYQVSTSGTTTPTGSWVAEVPSVPVGQFLWTKTVVTYSDGKSTTAYSVSRNGNNGTSVTITNQEVTYQAGTSGTTAPTGEWLTTVPSVPQGQFLWTKTVVTYSDGKSTTSYSVSRQGVNGQNGADALSLVILSSNGTIFKNTDIATTLSAHVYKGGVEVTGSALTALGTIKWYKDGGSSAVATGTNLTINPGDVTNNANYTAQLEG
nr:MAG TPA: tail protein [Caudoviricetes sp.]